jgi:hypothetical protein
MHKLAIIAVAGCAISAVSLGAAIAVGGRGGLPGFDHVDCPDTGATADRREINWDGGDSVAISVPATVHYAPGAGQTVIAKGDPQLLANLSVHNGRIDMPCQVHWHHRMLDITLPGRTFRAYDLEGLSELDLKNLSQDRLKISIEGKAGVTANGKVGDLEITVTGKGETHLKDLAAQRLSLNITGHGTVETSPQDDASITIIGRGDVKLYNEPRHISTTIMGSGNIQHLAKQS